VRAPAAPEPPSIRRFSPLRTAARSNLVLHLLRRQETQRLTATLRELITTLLPATYYKP
jgi:hypothetical protein